MTLQDLQPGESGKILDFKPSPVTDRLMEMGMLPGSEVQVVRLAPLGDPMDLKIQGYHLSIRKADAAQILVSKCES
ncbi:MAG: FeoA family protein [Bacteroidetes bacterium]|nr:FeoA family protein [Bacteroidota bacterium]MCY4205833.1 FeoA family protein [Bacteroidota bacterium]